MHRLTAKKTQREPLDWVEPFLTALANDPNVSHAAKRARISRTAVYNYRRDNEEFSARWDEAFETGIGALEDEGMRRALQGVKKPLVSGGKILGSVNEYSDTLLIFMLKSRRPEIYNPPTRQEIAGKDGGAIETKGSVTVDVSGLTMEQLKALAAWGDAPADGED